MLTHPNVQSLVRKYLWKGNRFRRLVWTMRRGGHLPPLLLVQRFDIPFTERLLRRWAHACDESASCDYTE